jgi:drug/metabolite transporter superfamily protein YnfA
MCRPPRHGWFLMFNVTRFSQCKHYIYTLFYLRDDFLKKTRVYHHPVWGSSSHVKLNAAALLLVARRRATATTTLSASGGSFVVVAIVVEMM